MKVSGRPSAETLAAAERIAARHPRAETVFVSGSLVEGYGNQNSDLDLFAVYRNPDDRPKSGKGIDLTFDNTVINLDYADGYRIDTEIWLVAEAEDAARRIEAAAWAGEAEAIGVPEFQLQLAHRIRVGQALAGEVEFVKLRDEFDWICVRRVLALRFTLAYNDAAEDAAGAVHAGEAGTALLASRSALGAAVDAYLASQGNTNNKQKWRFVKLGQIGADQLRDDYLRLELDNSAEDSSVLASAKKRLRYAGDLAHRTAEWLASADPK